MILLSKCGHSNQWVRTKTNDSLEVLQYFYLLFYMFSTVHYVYVTCYVIYCAFSFAMIILVSGGGWQAD